MYAIIHFSRLVLENIAMFYIQVQLFRVNLVGNAVSIEVTSREITILFYKQPCIGCRNQLNIDSVQVEFQNLRLSVEPGGSFMS